MYRIAQTDSYKFSHFLQYKPGTKHVSSYIESRGVEKGRDWKEMVVAGTVPLVENWLSKPLVTVDSLNHMKKRVALHGPSFNVEGFQQLLYDHGGYMPIKVQALAEGSVVPLKTPILQIVNIDPNFYWLTSYIETHVLRSIWYPSTVATVSFHIKRIIKDAMLRTAGHTEGLDFKLHDFGSRGVSSGESAQLGGMAHLYNFMGSDTFEATEFMADFYGDDMPAFSVDAAEHSTITSFGGPEFELEAFEHQLDQFGKEGKLFSVVSDSYNIWDAIDNKWGKILKARIESLGPINSKLVVRPDSGNPETVPVECIRRLGNSFGHTYNQKGFKVLPPYIGVLQGDGINEDSIKVILKNLELEGWSAENIVFGMGGELLQKVNRDTLKFAMKASAICGTGGWYDVYKDPIDDHGKGSKRGRQAVIREPRYGNILAVREDSKAMNMPENLLVDIYNNGIKAPIPKLSDIRARINAAL